MTTLLEIYESYYNGQKKQFVSQVTAYGKADFASDIGGDTDSEGLPVLTDKERYKMLKTYLIVEDDNEG